MNLELKKGEGGKRVKGCTQIRLLLAHETFEWIAVSLAHDRRGRKEKPIMSHVVEQLAEIGFGVLSAGARPTFVEHKVRGRVADTKARGRVVEFYCPAALFTRLSALRRQVNEGKYPSVAPTAKGVCLANVVRRLVELGIEQVESPPVKL
mgnify:FL=1